MQGIKVKKIKTGWYEEKKAREEERINKCRMVRRIKTEGGSSSKIKGGL